jgi:hypothetical protein
MPGKGQTTVDKDILIVLKANKGYALRFSDIYKALIKRELFHYQQQISNNLKKLIAEGKVVEVKGRPRSFYGIPNTRGNGTRYIVVKGAGIEDETVEV